LLACSFACLAVWQYACLLVLELLTFRFLPLTFNLVSDLMRDVYLTNCSRRLALARSVAIARRDQGPETGDWRLKRLP